MSSQCWLTTPSTGKHFKAVFHPLFMFFSEVFKMFPVYACTFIIVKFIPLFMLGCHLVLSLCLSCLGHHIVKISWLWKKNKVVSTSWDCQALSLTSEKTQTLEQVYYYPSGYYVILESDVSLRCSQRKRREWGCSPGWGLLGIIHGQDRHFWAPPLPEWA